MCTFHVIESDLGRHDPAAAALVDDTIARRRGSRPTLHRLPGARHPLLARWELQRRLRRTGPVDRIHAWSPLAALAAGGTDAPMTVTITNRQATGPTVRRLARLVRRGGVAVEVVNPVIADALIEAGVDARRIDVVEPILDPSRLERSNRPALRGRWGAGDRTMVVAVVGDPWTSVDAMWGTWIVGLVATTGRDVRIVASSRMRGVGRARRLVDAMDRPHQLLVDDRADSPWAVLPGCDAALVLEYASNHGGCDVRLDTVQGPGRAGGLSTRWAMAAGLPIVAEQTPAMNGLLVDGQAALVFPAGSACDAGRALARVYDDPALRRALGERAKAAMGQAARGEAHGL